MSSCPSSCRFEAGEFKEKKLETALNQKTKVQIPQCGNGTYVNVLKRHIQEKLSPQDGNNTSMRPEQWGRVQHDRLQRYYNTQNPQQSYTEAWRTAHSSDYQRDSREPRYRQEQERRRQWPRRQYFFNPGTKYKEIQKLNTPSSLRHTTTDTGTLEWKRTRSKENQIQFKRKESLIKGEILKR